MFGLKIFVRVQTFRRGLPVPPHNFCHPGPHFCMKKRGGEFNWSTYLFGQLDCGSTIVKANNLKNVNSNVIKIMIIIAFVIDVISHHTSF